MTYLTSETLPTPTEVEDTLLESERGKRLLSETLTEIALALTSHTRHRDVLDEILVQAKRLVAYQA
ncbi:MAG: hypothetical protein KDJ52_33080, partial [Anaerolineae bacterium]|nr:hypothetical protein [Anaerolineae bacterium]